jgi:ectoine hydroxylase-related dioxygenase (phytanoyl-CoA dioxygenase family)
VITPLQIHQFEQNGYTVVPQMFLPEEVKTHVDHFMRLRHEGSFAGDFAGVNADEKDPLKAYPRMIHMHRWDDLSLRWMLDPRINRALTALLGREPYAVQTMLYFKPAGARGQALHQDNYYLRVQPGTCIAAWLALDDCDEENGCMQVVVGSHAWPVLCTVGADLNQSFTDVTVPLPTDADVRPVLMKAGDVLFFNGQLVHGSYPNTSKDRFRRSLIGHYIEGDAQQVGRWYHPALRMDGSPVELEESSGSTQCGVWVERDGSPVIEMAGVNVVDHTIHD